MAEKHPKKLFFVHNGQLLQIEKLRVVLASLRLRFSAPAVDADSPKLIHFLLLDSVFVLKVCCSFKLVDSFPQCPQNLVLIPVFFF